MADKGGAAVKVQMTAALALALGELYDRAKTLQSRFAKTHKVTMTRLAKYRMKSKTIVRLLDGIESVLSGHGLNDQDAGILDACRAHVHAEIARQRDDDALPVNVAMDAARTARSKLVDVGMPPSTLPALGDVDQFIASASRVVASIQAYLGGHCDERRAAAWATRAAELSASAGDEIAIEEAARIVELACRWAADRFAEDDQAGTDTLTGPLVEPPSSGLTIRHLEGAIILDQAVYDGPLVGDLSFARVWLSRYPFAYHVVATRALGRVLGYAAVLPMTLEGIADALRDGNDARVPGHNVAICAPGERVHLYIPSVVIRSDCDRVKVKNQLRSSFMTSLGWLRGRGVEIDSILAIGYTDGGRSLLSEHGFQCATDLEQQLGVRSSLLNDSRRLYVLVKDCVPRTVYGALVHHAAFGPVQSTPEPLRSDLSEFGGGNRTV